MTRIFHGSLLRFILLFSILFGSGCVSQLPSPTPVTVTRPPISSTPSSSSATPIAIVPTERSSGPLFVNPDNPQYFTDGVKVNGKYRSIYLTGSHTWCNFIDCGNTNPPLAFDYDKYLDFLQANNFNFFRLWRAENSRGGEAGPDFWFDPMPYQRSGECCAFDGGNKFDLEKFNQAYFDRMRKRIIEARDRGIYVSIMLFDGWSIESKFDGHDPWVGHPYKVENNINSINGDVNGNGQGEDTHVLTGTPVTALQEAYVQKVIDTVNDLDNVLYEISNESPGDNPSTAEMDGSKDWQYHMVQFVKQYEAKKPRQHPVGMTWEWLNGNNQVLYESPANWISLGGGAKLEAYEPPVSSEGSKLILADTDHLCGICGNAQWVWKSFTRGENPIFMDIYDNATSGRGMPFSNPSEEEVRRNLGYTRSYADRMNLTVMTPQPKVCSTGYCLVNSAAEGAEYLVFLPARTSILSQLGINSNGKLMVDLSVAIGELSVEWFNPASGETTQGEAVVGGSSETFTVPFSGDVVLYIYDNTP